MSLIRGWYILSGGIAGGMLAVCGVMFPTWQFWVMMLVMIVLVTVSVAIGAAGRK